nr:hypothetical protein [uncultured Roseibium sp.]
MLILLIAGVLMSLVVTGLVLTLGQTGQWIGFALLLLFLYPAAVLSMKRLRDRGRAHLHLWLTAYFAPGLLANFAQTSGIGFTYEDIGGIPVSSPTALGGTLMILGFLAFLTAIVDLGFLKGKAAQA